MAGRPSDTGAPWRRAEAQVRVDDLVAPVLSPDDLHHLGRVLRLRAGAQLCVTDGAGGWRLAAFTGTAAPEPVGEVHREPAHDAVVTVGFVPVKGDRPELVVQKLTEIGVDRIVPLVADRSVVRWDDDRAARQFERFRRIASEACAQSRRLWAPVIGLDGADRPVSPADLWAAPSNGAAAGSAVGSAVGAVLAEPGGRQVAPGDVTVLVGPEGGWSPSELEAAAADGVEHVDLGSNVLRAETAAIVAGVLLTSGRAVGRPHRPTP